GHTLGTAVNGHREAKERESNMSTPQDPGRAAASPALTSLPRVEDLPQAPGGGYDADRVRDAFEAFRRHSAQLQAQLRVLQAASRTGQSVEPTGHAVRMDSLHLIRAEIG